MGSSSMRVSGSSSVKNVAMCLVRFLEKPGSQNVELRAIGAGAVNQAVKSIASARCVLGERGLDLTVRIGFACAESGEARGKTAMTFTASVSGKMGGCDG